MHKLTLRIITVTYPKLKNENVFAWIDSREGLQQSPPMVIITLGPFPSFLVLMFL